MHFSFQLGVYLPEKRKPLGIYIPRPVSPDTKSSGSGQPKPIPTRPRPKPKRQRSKQQQQQNRQDSKRNKISTDRRDKPADPKQDLPVFSVNYVKPESPIGKFFRLGNKKSPKPKNPRPRPEPSLLLAASERNHQNRKPLRGRNKPKYVRIFLCFLSIVNVIE